MPAPANRNNRRPERLFTAAQAASNRLAVEPGPTVRRNLLTVAEVCGELQIAQSTFYDWRTKGTGPRCIKLPNSQLRVRRADLDAWLAARQDAA